MSSWNDYDKCKYCGGENCDYADASDGIGGYSCRDCGVYTAIRIQRLSLEELNAEREDFDLPPLDELPELLDLYWEVAEQ